MLYDTMHLLITEDNFQHSNFLRLGETFFKGKKKKKQKKMFGQKIRKFKVERICTIKSRVENFLRPRIITRRLFKNYVRYGRKCTTRSEVAIRYRGKCDRINE